jgi:hypothetical protein
MGQDSTTTVFKLTPCLSPLCCFHTVFFYLRSSGLMGK